MKKVSLRSIAKLILFFSIWMVIAPNTFAEYYLVYSVPNDAVFPSCGGPTHAARCSEEHHNLMSLYLAQEYDWVPDPLDP